MDLRQVIRTTSNLITLGICTAAGLALTSPALVRDYLLLELAQFEEEHFALILLDNKHQVIDFKDIARGFL